MKYTASDGDAERIKLALKAVLPSGTPLEVITAEGHVVTVRIAKSRALVRWLPRGWPRQVRDALASTRRLDIVVAPSLSAGARELLSSAHIGWVDETGSAQFSIGYVVVSREGVAPRTRPPNHPWTPATLAIAEAVLTGITATVSAIKDTTGLSTGTVTTGLRRLTNDGYLEATQNRGRASGRTLHDAQGLLDAYASHVTDLQRNDLMLRVGALWRDPVNDARHAADGWRRVQRTWAATGALAAAVLAPYQTQVAPLDIFVKAASPSDLQLAATELRLPVVDAGRLTLRAFPSPATARLCTSRHGLNCAPWPRVYADLRSTGVRGEDAAEHLREQVANEKLV
jgi:hypothetical protein